MLHRDRVLLLAVGALLAPLLVGCHRNAQRDEQLHSVAKDWSTTIRASQVIPVYPMTEDLQVGDVFLVQRTVEDQHKAYLEKGFLPFENHLARLKPLSYDGAYGRSFFADGEHGSVMPRFWLTPAEPVSFARAPAAAFPAYTFSVSSGSGFSAALPIQGVPVGLSLLNSDSAVGSVTLKDARTYGLPIMDLAGDVRAWADDAGVQETLGLYAPHKNGAGETVTNYVRVVSRVYLVGKVGVTLSDTGSRSGGLDVGVPKPVELPLLAAPAKPGEAEVRAASTDSYTKGLTALNNALAASAARDAAGKLLPGASMKVVSASARSVSIDETFKRPVAVGYLGFDMAILDGGLLGPPCPTFAVLERGSTPATDQHLPGLVRARSMRDVGLYRALGEVAEGSSSDKAAALAIRAAIDETATAALTGHQAPTIWSMTPERTLKAQIPAGPIQVGPRPYRTLMTHAAQLRGSIAVLSEGEDRRALTPEQRADRDAASRELDRLVPVFRAIDEHLTKADDLLVR